MPAVNMTCIFKVLTLFLQVIPSELTKSVRPVTHSNLNEKESMALPLIELMTVEPAESVDVLVGTSEAYGVIGIYGGHFVGQARTAVLATMEEP